MATIMKNFISIITKGQKILSSNDGFKMAIVVRTDVCMGKGKIAAQCAHAALECYRKAAANDENQRVLEMWLLSGQPKIVLKISSQRELLDLATRAKKSGVITAMIRDAGRTQLAPGTISVFGIGPGPKNQIEQLTSDLKLL